MKQHLEEENALNFSGMIKESLGIYQLAFKRGFFIKLKF